MNFIRKLMYGRYGADHLSLFLMGLYMVLYLVSIVPFLWFFSWVAIVPGAIALLRMFSRNITKRRSENAKFLTLAGPAISWWRLHRTRRKDKDHCYFKCPNCGQHLRVPKGKGKITVTCRNCGVSFEEKS